MEDVNVTGALVTLAILFLLYFVPTWIAGARNHHNQYAILALNLFLGWTFVGWVVALVWALTAVNKAQQPGHKAQVEKWIEDYEEDSD